MEFSNTNKNFLKSIIFADNIFEEIPYFGDLIKNLLIKYLKTRNRFYSLPNKILNKKIVPELIDVLTPKMISNKIINLFNNPEALQKQIKAFQSVRIIKDIDVKICKDILSKSTL